MFGTSGIRGPVGEAVTAELALSVGRALGVDTDSVVIGRDARDSGRALSHALAAGLMESGTDVIDLGVVATPTAARTVGRVGADAGAVVTASHNPPQDNGLKLWSPSGQAFDEERRSIIADRMAEQTIELAPWDGHGERSADVSAVNAHQRALVEAGQQWFETESRSGDDVSVVVDVGNGTGGVTVDALRALDVSVETLNGRPDGRFPARPSEPTADTCESLARFVQAGDADLGVAHDGDADRMMAVDETGTFVPGDLLLATFAHEIAGDGDRVAAPVDTSLAVDDALADVGAELVHTSVGDVFVAEKTRQEGVVFGGEPSGAWIFPSETLCPDGPLAAVRLAILAAAQPLSERVASFEPYPIRRTSIETTAKTAVMEAVHADSTAITGAVTTLDGVRVSRDEGWFLIRASGTQPLVRLTAEARDDTTTDQLFEEAHALVTAAVDRTES
ncbi:MAG: phosphoglucosamine mutase [uncultured archaeon A07HR60]|nr:MAG: phosphoglucosamine mutase [uncultured archaeon A07HR60]